MVQIEKGCHNRNACGGILIAAYTSIFLILISADKAGYFTQGSTLVKLIMIELSPIKY